MSASALWYCCSPIRCRLLTNYHLGGTHCSVFTDSIHHPHHCSLPSLFFLYLSLFSGWWLFWLPFRSSKLLFHCVSHSRHALWKGIVIWVRLFSHLACSAVSLKFWPIVVCDYTCQPSVSNLSAQKDPRGRRERKASRWVPILPRLQQHLPLPC